MSLELPELPKCPYHGDNPPKRIGECQICWTRFYIPFDFTPQLNRMNFAIRDYHDRVNRANRLIALQEQGFTTHAEPPKDVPVLFALPNGEEVLGRSIDDMCGGTYPVRDDAAQTPISIYSGWKRVE